MNAVGIIAEYNPLHNGHVYHLNEAKRLAGSEVVVVAMSGDYVQRGEPAILDKWERAEIAISCGADIVLEIPTYFCLGNARQYGAAGVFLLESFGNVTHLVFGSETGDISALKSIADNLGKKAVEIEKEMKAFLKDGLSYPKARAVAYTKIFGKSINGCAAEDISGDIAILEGSNDILALEYIMACEKMEPVAIARVGAGYYDSVDDIKEFQSATGIRELIHIGEKIYPYVPDITAYMLDNKINTFVDEWLDILKYCVITSTAEVIDRCPSGGEGIGNRMKTAISDVSSWENFIQTVKSKRYTYTRISRLCMQLILNIDRKKYVRSIPAYIRILGLSERGREMIAEVKKDRKNRLPIITNINREYEELGITGRLLLNLDTRGADIYNLITGRNIKTNSDHRVTPVIR